MQNNVNTGANTALPVTTSQMPQMVNVQAMSMGHIPNNIELNMNVPGGMAPMTVNHTSYIPTQPQNQMQTNAPAPIQASQSQVHQQQQQQQQPNYTNGNGGGGGQQQQQPQSMHTMSGGAGHVPYTAATSAAVTANYPLSAPASVTSINPNNLCDMNASGVGGVIVVNTANQNPSNNNHNAINSQASSSNVNVNNATTNYVNQNTNLNSGCAVVGGGGGVGGGGVGGGANSDRTNPCATSASIVTGNTVITGQASQTIGDGSGNSAGTKVMSPSSAAGTATSVVGTAASANGNANAASASASCSSSSVAASVNNNATPVVTSSAPASVKYSTTPENDAGMNAVDGATTKTATSTEDGQSAEDSERYVSDQPTQYFVFCFFFFIYEI